MKTFEYKENLKGKITVRTNGIVLPESKSVKVNHLQSKGANYNVYTVTKNWLNKNIDTYF